MSKPATLKDLIEQAGEQAKRVMIGLGRDLMPTWVLIDDQGKISILGTPWKNDFERRVAKAAMRQLFLERHIVAYSFVSEAWTATKPAGWTPPPDYQGARNEPDRQEIVIAFATDGKTQEFRRWSIHRDEKENVWALELMEAKEADPPPLQGWVTELLK